MTIFSNDFITKEVRAPGLKSFNDSSLVFEDRNNDRVLLKLRDPMSQERCVK